jgi:hypothetical protein
MNTIPMSNVRAFYAGAQPEGRWFSKANMCFHKTKLPRTAYQGPAGTMFVTRETDWSDATRYSVRVQREDGRIETVGEFHSYLTRADAIAEIKRLNLAAAH